jgi:hypothetical protein
MSPVLNVADDLKMGTSQVDAVYLGGDLVWPVGSTFSPIVDLSWENYWWAEDPAWTPPADGGAVSSWTGGGAKAGNMAQASPTLQPLYRASAATRLNSKPSVEFDNSDDAMVATVTAPTLTGNKLSYVCILDLISVPSNTRNVFGNGTAGTLYAVALANGPNWRIRFAGTARTGGTPAADTAYMARSLLDAAGTNADTLHVNETSTISGANAGASAHSTGLVLGPDGAGASMRIAFAGVYSGDITADAKWADFKTWVGTHYGLTLA